MIQNSHIVIKLMGSVNSFKVKTITCIINKKSSYNLVIMSIYKKKQDDIIRI